MKEFHITAHRTVDNPALDKGELPKEARLGAVLHFIFELGRQARARRAEAQQANSEQTQPESRTDDGGQQEPPA